MASLCFHIHSSVPRFSILLLYSHSPSPSSAIPVPLWMSSSVCFQYIRNHCVIWILYGVHVPLISTHFSASIIIPFLSMRIEELWNRVWGWPFFYVRRYFFTHLLHNLRRTLSWIRVGGFTQQMPGRWHAPHPVCQFSVIEINWILLQPLQTAHSGTFAVSGIQLSKCVTLLPERKTTSSCGQVLTISASSPTSVSAQLVMLLYKQTTIGSIKQFDKESLWRTLCVAKLSAAILMNNELALKIYSVCFLLLLYDLCWFLWCSAFLEASALLGDLEDLNFGLVALNSKMYTQTGTHVRNSHKDFHYKRVFIHFLVDLCHHKWSLALKSTIYIVYGYTEKVSETERSINWK